ncbi:response regulator [soil metagenome]
MDEPIKVLLARSRPEELEVLRDMMRSLELKVLDVVADGPQVVEAAQECRPDVVLMAAELVGVDCSWAARRIRQDLGIPVILLSAQGDPDWIDQKVEAGLFNFLIKPFTATALYAKIRGVIAEREDRFRWEQDRRVIDRAKGVLMQSCRLTESEAYARLRRQSMHLHRTMPDLARDVIAAADLLFWTPPSGRG